MRRHAALLALTALICSLAACQGSPLQSPGGPQAAQVPLPPAPQTRKEAHSAGSFASLTVESEEGQQEPLAVETLDVQVQIEGRLARTRVKQVFRNKLHRQAEGVYSFQLPDGASISRLQMDVEGQMMEGELVERERARQIYEDIVQRRKDPALLEWQGGNRFKTQIFPIPAQGTKTVILTYEERLSARQGRASYTYQMPRLEGDRHTPIGDFRFSLQADADSGTPTPQGYPAQVRRQDKDARVEYQATAFVPQGPLEVDFARAPRVDAEVRYARRDGQGFFQVDLIPQAKEAQPLERRDLVVVVDSSAGLGQPEVARGAWLASALIHDLGPQRRFLALHGDIEARACQQEPAGASQKQATFDCLASLDAGGATDLGALLEAAAGSAARLGDQVDIVLFTDGVASLGQLDADLLRDQWRRQAEQRPGWRLHTVGVGHGPDMGFLQSLARQSGGHALRVTPDQPPEAAHEELSWLLRSPLLTDLKLSVSQGQARDLEPGELPSLPYGAPLAVLGRLDSGPATIHLEAKYQGQTLRQEIQVQVPQSASDGLLPGFWARARIDSLQGAQAPREQVVALSKNFGVMSQYTSFLVLENQQAYERFQVERRQHAYQQQQPQEQRGEQFKNLEKGDGDLAKLLQEKEEEKKIVDKIDVADLKRDKDEAPEEEEVKELAKKTLTLSPRDTASNNGLLALRGNGDGEGGPGTLGEEEPEPKLEVLHKEIQSEHYGRGRLVRRTADGQGPKGGEGTLGGLGKVDSGGGSGSLGVAPFGQFGQGRGGGGVSERGLNARKPSAQGQRQQLGDADDSYAFGVAEGDLSTRRKAVPTLQVGQARVQGTCSKEVLVRVARRYQRQLTQCYERELVRNRDLAGKMTLELVIDTRGEVRGAFIKDDTLRNRRVASCITDRAKRWRFPTPYNDGICRFSYPITLDKLNKLSRLPHAPDKVDGDIALREAPLAVGYRDGEGLLRMFYASQRQLNACYHKHVRPDQPVHEPFKVEVQLNPTGQAVHTWAHTDLKQPRLQKCLEEVLMTWTLPGYQGPEHLRSSWELELRPGLRYHRATLQKEERDAWAQLAQAPQDPQLRRAWMLHALLLDPARAQKQWSQWKAEAIQAGRPERLLPLVDSALGARAFGEELAPLLLERARSRSLELQQPNEGQDGEGEPDTWLPWLREHAYQRGQGQELLQQLKALPMSPYEAQARLELLEILHRRARPEQQRDHLQQAAQHMSQDPWWTPARRFDALQGMEITALLVLQRDTCLALLEQGDARPQVMQEALRVHPYQQQGKLWPALERGCSPGGAYPLSACQQLFVPALREPSLSQKLHSLLEKRAFAELLEQRRRDMGNVQLIQQILEHKQRGGEAWGPTQRRLLSEMVEFNPHDHSARMIYARQHIQREGDVPGGCAQMAAAVQLDPSQRDTFRDMMRLRRDHPEQAQALRQCLVQGVSQLPVQRDISLLLTWEDPMADVDLHIHEASGEHVWYQDRESQKGGLLYYDITDGFGPEIYVLGGAPKGSYRLDVIYYSGQARDLRGTLTVLRHAGTSRETRQDFPFVLPSADREQPYTLTTLEL